MTREEAELRASKLGLSAWVTHAVAVGRVSRTIELYCLGFESADLPLAEAESWEEAFAIVDRIIA